MTNKRQNLKNFFNRPRLAGAALLATPGLAASPGSLVSLPVGYTRVEVKLIRHPNDTTAHIFMVRVYSNRPQGCGGALVSQGAVDPKQGKIQGRIMLTAAGLAEYQNNNHGDTHDPQQVAEAANEAFVKIIENMRRGAQPLPA